MLAGVESTKVWLWELPSLEPRAGFSLLARSVSQVKVSGDSETLYVTEKDGPIGLYDLPEPEAVVVMRSSGGCDGLGPQGPAVVFSGDGSQQIPLEIWDSDERQTIARGNFLTTLGRSDQCIALSPDGTLAASAEWTSDHNVGSV